MTFEEWFIYEYGPNWKANYSEESYFLAEASWNAAKEDSKPVAKITEQDRDYFYIDASDASDCVEKYSTLWEYPRFYTKDAANNWAIDNGYRVEEDQ